MKSAQLAANRIVLSKRSSLRILRYGGCVADQPLIRKEVGNTPAFWMGIMLESRQTEVFADKVFCREHY